MLWPSLLTTTAVADPHPRREVTVLTVNNGQEVLVDLQGEGRAVRLACIQAPLAEQKPWAERATAQLRRSLQPGSIVALELRARDVYGRVVARLINNGADVAAPLLRQGAVFAYDGYLGQCNDLDYDRFESTAKTAQLGIWSVPGGIKRPWNLIEASGGRLAP
ncbi:thermonuclease family protein [Synechococcus sp. WH 7805]|uniref:thermonuclease family protein n=2 Tax=Synechococcus TaxID=1129 RepID=UPI00056F4F2C|nr:thermonuclease family protein [Synechococcus sp. WH 7805]